MQAVKKGAAQLFARFKLRDANRLWLQYCVALLLVACLMLMAHVLINTVISRGLVTAQGVKKSNAQIFLAQDIVSQAEILVNQQDPRFDRFHASVQQFAENHAALAAFEFTTGTGSDSHFSSDQPLSRHVQDYVTLADEFANGSDGMRVARAAQLRERYPALHDQLLLAATWFVDRVAVEAVHFNRLKHAILAASVIVLLAEVLFIFIPTHEAVKTTIRQMQRQTSSLQSSQKKLKQMNERLEHIINHDQLTGLPNRAALTAYLTDTVRAKNTDGWNLILIGLDDFKSINDTTGHDFGDALLIAVSHALRSCVDYENMVARVGGDEFVLTSDEPIAQLLKRVLAALAEPFEIRGRRFQVNASIGHVVMDYAQSAPLVLLADAEIALQFAKNAGGNRTQAFTANLRDDLGLMQQLQLDLSDAIRNGEIEPWFQPQVRLADGRLHGAEVLARWRHPTRGLLTPDVFLPAAERAGLMVDLDHAIWTTAMRHARQWQQNQLWQPLISLNAAPDTIADPHFIERFLLNLQRSGLCADQVIVEVLETTLINGKDDMAAINIDSLAECGIALELDDFGTGYASLSKLTQLPLKGIKLDRSLVAPLPDQAADSIVRAILALATELGLHVIAEGIEEGTQARHLTDRGCGIGQGYGFGRPMPPDDFARWLGMHAQNPLFAGHVAPLPAKRA